jgi:2'-5' RNA ligase
MATDSPSQTGYARTVPASGRRFAIALGFDESTAAVIRRVRLNIGFARDDDATSPPPHITLAACSGLNTELFRVEAAGFAAHTPRLPCTLASIGIFPTVEGVLYLAPSITADLVQLQLEVVDRLRAVGAEIERYWLPGQWVPHCTLALGIPREEIATAVAGTLTGWQPLAGHLVRLGVASIDPPELRYEFPLGRT